MSILKRFKPSVVYSSEHVPPGFIPALKAAGLTKVEDDKEGVYQRLCYRARCGEFPSFKVKRTETDKRPPLYVPVGTTLDKPLRHMKTPPPLPITPIESIASQLTEALPTHRFFEIGHPTMNRNTELLERLVVAQEQTLATLQRLEAVWR